MDYTGLNLRHEWQTCKCLCHVCVFVYIMSIDFLLTINKNGYCEWLERMRKQEIWKKERSVLLDYYLLTID